MGKIEVGAIDEFSKVNPGETHLIIGIRKIGHLSKMNLYFASGNIAFVFSAIMVCNRTYAAPASRDLEIAPTNGYRRAEAITI